MTATMEDLEAKLDAISPEQGPDHPGARRLWKRLVKRRTEVGGLAMWAQPTLMLPVCWHPLPFPIEASAKFLRGKRSRMLPVNRSALALRAVRERDDVAELTLPPPLPMLVCSLAETVSPRHHRAGTCSNGWPRCRSFFSRFPGPTQSGRASSQKEKLPLPLVRLSPVMGVLHDRASATARSQEFSQEISREHVRGALRSTANGIACTGSSKKYKDIEKGWRALEAVARACEDRWTVISAELAPPEESDKDSRGHEEL